MSNKRNNKSKRTTKTILIILLSFVGLRFLFPMIMSIVHQSLIGLLIIAAIIIFLCVNKTSKKIFNKIVDFISGLFCKEDPIETLEDHVEQLKMQQKEMNGQVNRLNNQIVELEKLVRNNKKEMETKIRIASQAKQQNNQEVMQLNLRQYGRLKSSVLKYENLIAKLRVSYKVISKIYNNASYLIQDTVNEINIRKQESLAINNGYSALNNAKTILTTDKQKKKELDKANKKLAEELSLKLKGMDEFIALSNKTVEKIDIENETFEQEGMDLLDKLELQGYNILDNESDKQLREELDQILKDAHKDTVEEFDIQMAEQELLYRK